MSTSTKITSKPNTNQTEAAATIAALRAVCGDVGCDWLSSHGPRDKEIDLTELCGGSGWYYRPVKAAK
jgi:hypothetical protein